MRSLFRYVFLIYLLLGSGATIADQNFYACKTGTYGCSEQLLTTEQKDIVHRSTLERNFYACKTGIYGCSEQLLTTEQKDIVHRAALERNFYACKTGIYGCSEQLLTTEQKDIVHRSTLERNFYACKTSAYSCNRNLLNVEQNQQLEPVISKPQPVPGARCAENGACYGDISNATGLPKTTHVNGYFRKDGTYVQGHYRSKR